MVIGQNFQSMQSLCTYSFESNLQTASTVDLEWELKLELLGHNLSVMPKKKVSEVASPNCAKVMKTDQKTLLV
jgi:hypothetical protein